MDAQEPPFNVNAELQKFRLDIRKRISDAYYKTNVRYDDAQANFSQTIQDNPEAVVRIDANDSHLFVVFMDELYDFLEAELKSQGSSLLETKSEDKHRTIHEFDHVQALIGLDKRIDGFGVLMCLDKDNLPDSIPFVSHEKLSKEDDRIVALAPRGYRSPGDEKIAAENR